MKFKAAIKAINKNGILLVFPKNNQKEPKSLWSEFYPKTKMKWEWDDDGDDRVASLWHLMKKLSDCREVVYSKWYQGRATFFSRELFTAMLALLQKTPKYNDLLSREAHEILSTLEADSPLSTRDVKKLTELQGRDNESRYSRAMKDLFLRMQIVAFGEVNDGAFPSLAVAATANIYEDLWKPAQKMTQKEAELVLSRSIPASSPFRRFFDKTVEQLSDKNTREKNS
ncbi:MAG: hypothetical protein AB7F59_03225 [Bdellovibrionales bacterium]